MEHKDGSRVAALRFRYEPDILFGTGIVYICRILNLGKLSLHFKIEERFPLFSFSIQDVNFRTISVKFDVDSGHNRPSNWIWNSRQNQIQVLGPADQYPGKFDLRGNQFYWAEFIIRVFANCSKVRPQPLRYKTNTFDSFNASLKYFQSQRFP